MSLDLAKHALEAQDRITFAQKSCTEADLALIHLARIVVRCAEAIEQLEAIPDGKGRHRKFTLEDEGVLPC